MPRVSTMISLLRDIVERLKDPALVRSIQEAFWVSEIVIDVEGCSTKELNWCVSLSSSSSSSDESAGEFQTEGWITGSAKEEKKPEMQLNPSSSLHGSLKWLSSKTTKRRRVSTPPSYSSPALSYKSDSATTVPVEDKPKVLVVETNSFIDTYFRLASEFGYETFYIVFFPLLFWNVDICLARQVMIMWAFSMYFGQAAKHVFNIKRPASPPAIRLENNPTLETEYGFPSTHATVGISIPFSLVYFSIGRYEFSLWLGLLLACVCSTSVIISRVYLGVHSVLDVIAGMLIAVFLFPVVTLITIVIEQWYFVYDYFCTGPIILILFIFLIYIYPVDSSSWSRDRGDTAAIMGGTLGVLLAQCIVGYYPDDLIKGPFTITFPSMHMLSLCVMRFVVGLLLLLPTRFIMKLLCYKFLPMVMPTHGVKETGKRPLVEIPYKIITYGLLGFNSALLNIIVFEICGISRWDQSILS